MRPAAMSFTPEQNHLVLIDSNFRLQIHEVRFGKLYGILEFKI
jgi:hypothetical protein